MKKILVIGKPTMDVYNAIDFLKLYYQIQMADVLQNAPNMIMAYQPDLLLIVGASVNEPTTLFFRSLRMNYSNLPFMTIGTMDEKRNVESCLYNGIDNIAIPFDGNRAVQQVAAKLGIASPLNGQGTSPTGAAGRKKVLIVDDNAPTLRTIKGLLEDSYQVLVAPNGPKGLEIMERSMPALVLLDYEMPGMNGKEVFLTMKKDELLSLIPVVFLTAVNDKEQIVEVLSLQPQGYLLKPTTREKLFSTIQKLIGS
ncbi:MAG: response regulator [Lachnospiraceae bacterium]|nr:response regulator [Lachnospiraceae bacterium]